MNHSTRRRSKRLIPLTLKADLADLCRDRHRLAGSVGPRGEAVFLLVAEADAATLTGYDTQPGGQFPRSRADRGVAATILLHDGVVHSTVPVSDLALAHPLVQPLPGDEYLVVGARCRRLRDGKVEHNACVYASDGTLQRTMAFGDGIEDVQATSAGDVWVSYFDEGVFGNFGWGDTPDAPPVGAAGLVLFGADGCKKWDFVPPAGLGPMADCYALNVADEAAWAYYYTEFPIVRITAPGEVRAWCTDIAGASAFAVDSRRVLVFGGYSRNRYSCTLAELGDERLAKGVKCELDLPSGEVLKDARIIGRGSILHVFTGSRWYQADLNDL